MFKIIDNLTQQESSSYESKDAAIASEFWADAAEPTLVEVLQQEVKSAPSSVCTSWEKAGRGAWIYAKMAVKSNKPEMLKQAMNIIDKARIGKDPVTAALLGAKFDDDNRLLCALRQAGEVATTEDIAEAIRCVNAHKEKESSRAKHKATKAKEQEKIHGRKKRTSRSRTIVSALPVGYTFVKEVRKSTDVVYVDTGCLAVAVFIADGGIEAGKKYTLEIIDHNKRNRKPVACEATARIIGEVE